MWEQANLEPRRMSRKSFVVSFVLHLIVLGALSYKVVPVLLPSPSLRGNGGRAQTTIALVSPGESVLKAIETADSNPDKHLVAPHKTKKKKAPPKPAAVQAAVSADALQPGMPGFILGSLTEGFISNHDVRVALPVVAPDPPINRSRLPDWIRGDVVVEVTIDEQGNVTNTVVLEKVGFGLEDKIVATLRQWHFTPAKVDGVAVASRQDVHFHFPT